MSLLSRRPTIGIGVFQTLLLLSIGFVAVLFAAAPTPLRAAPAPTRPKPPETVERANPCHTVVVYELGKADNFAAPQDPVYPSLALQSLLQGGNSTAYDGTQCDRWFGDTFRVDSCVFCCGICSATLEITLKGCGSYLECNDYILVGKAPFRGAGGYVLWEGHVNEPQCTDTGSGDPFVPDLENASNRTASKQPSSTLSPVVVKKIELDPRKIAEWICERGMKEVDVFLEDDQLVDSMRLVITKP